MQEDSVNLEKLICILVIFHSEETSVTIDSENKKQNKSFIGLL